MSRDTAGVARLPNPPEKYDGRYFDQVWRTLRLWMNSVVSQSQSEVAELAIETTTATSVTVSLSGNTYLIDTTAGSVTVTLPDPSTVVGRTFIIKRITGGGNTLTIQGTSGNIDGAASVSISVQYNSLTFKSDGTNYWLI